MQLLAHVTSYEYGSGIAIFLTGVIIGQLVSQIGNLLKARRS
jgi:hypothetical protein